MATVNFSALAAITRRTPDQIKALNRADCPLWTDADFPGATEGKRRRYDASHALRVLLVEALTSRGETTDRAVEAVTSQANVIDLFLSELAEGRAQPRFILLLTMVEEDSMFGARFGHDVRGGYGTPEEIGAAITAGLARVGRTVETRDGRSTRRTIGGPFAAVASVNECFRLLKLRAEAAGYLIDGRRILPLGTPDTEGDE
jgi:hypothetical protein